ncbi:MAG: aconitate hydratase [Candidatus Sericytochromatia bacterium]|nr:aconitate hydratase [Candidatus Sericytochromatia bacterium]
MPTIETTPDALRATYEKMAENVAIVRDRLKRPLTLSEKILFGHLDQPQSQPIDAGKAYLMLRPDRVIMQDATAQMAILQFMQAGVFQTAVPTTVHADHLIQAYQGAAKDTEVASITNREVYDFLRSAASKYGMGFWGPGSGIIHQVVLENYAAPGTLMIGSDSHTPNAGGLGMIAVGVGGADTVDVMAGFAWELLQPKLIGVKLTGTLNGWASPKDIILWVAGQLTVKGGTNAIVEYFGPGTESLSCTGKATICNMGAEIGATSSVFPYDARMRVYLEATERADLVPVIEAYQHLLVPDAEVLAAPERFYDQVLELDLSTLEPHIVGPHSPDYARPISRLAADAKAQGWPMEVSAALIGSCTNSSYEDMHRASQVAAQAAQVGSKSAAKLSISPGSAAVFETARRDGLTVAFEDIGAVVMANACGPCIGQWKRDEFKKGEKNTIVSSFNRNFPGRNDANPETFAFVASPEITIALGLAGSLAFNPLTDDLAAPDGKRIKLTAPTPSPEVPPNGYVGRRFAYEAPAADPEKVQVVVPEGSERLQILEPFSRLVVAEYADMPVLIKTKGKTTTDHISPAGPWLRFRGHLDRISDNMLTGAINAWTGERGTTQNAFTREINQDVPAVARDYKARGHRWVVIGDENYGEGSSREHAAMSPRFLGGAAVIVRSFARIHETNLKKQGILPLTFVDPSDYEKIQEGDTLSLENLQDLAPHTTINALIKHRDGTQEVIALHHTMNQEQIGWFHAGGALNLLRQKAGAPAR